MAVESEMKGETLRAYVAILGASPLPTAVLDRECRIWLWNPAAERLLGWTAEEVIGGSPPGIPEEEQGTIEAQFQQALKGDTVTGLESRYRTKAGDLLAVRLAAAP